MTLGDHLSLFLVAAGILVAAYLCFQAWSARRNPRRLSGFAILAIVALFAPVLSFFAFFFRDGLGPDAQQSTGFEALARWLPEVWAIWLASALLIAFGGYLARRAA